GDELLSFALEPRIVREDMSPEVIAFEPPPERRATSGRETAARGAFRGHTAHLRLSSFLPQYFEREKWLDIVSSLAPYERLIIDLRGNSGGSFPAMLRVLSTFFCTSEEIGSLTRSSVAIEHEEEEAAVLADTLISDLQLRQL